MKQILILSLLILSAFSVSVAQNSDKCESKFDSTLKRSIYIIVDKMPTFPDGKESMVTYIKGNLMYPEKECIEGSVFISFIVEPDGQLSNKKIFKGITKKADKAALDLVNAMPNWIPGSCNNEIVPTQMVIPIRFNLTE
ncbi:TonB family protein [Algoriphagus aquimarinus]|uniref:TonB family protein n=1 Tax=Algoriphagus aquimarinus TaxID=237018 RepID=A0A5C7B0W9_9BACT|nr:TonB family protein [Algoriphagus aquimarinus]TXE14508.1 TonB family protein [Algoriphagus aquimarinus]